MPKPVTIHPSGRYRFLRGAPAFSSGVAASPGYQISHASLSMPIAWKDGLIAACNYLESAGLGSDALCAVELRCAGPHSMNSFSSFNDEYFSLLNSWSMLVNGQNPVARTNVAPVIAPPSETMLHAFSYVEPSEKSKASFVISGGAELPYHQIDRSYIVRLGETSADAIVEKAACTAKIMRHRLNRLELGDGDITQVNVYTKHSIGHVFDSVFAKQLPIDRTGITWFYSQPPIVELEFEMSMRGVQRELTVNF